MGGEGVLQGSGVCIGNGVGRGKIPLGHNRKELMADLVGQDIGYMGVKIIESFPHGLCVESILGQGEGAGIGGQGGMVAEKGRLVFRGGDGVPLGAELPRPQGDGGIPQHLPDGVVIGQCHSHNGEVILVSVVELGCLRQVKGKDTVLGDLDAPRL